MRCVAKGFLLSVAIIVCGVGCSGGDPPAPAGNDGVDPAVAQGTDSNAPDAPGNGNNKSGNKGNTAKPPAGNGGSQVLPGGGQHKATDNSGQPAGGNGAPLDVSFISDDFFAALVVYPRRALESKLVGKATRRPADAALPPQIEDALGGLEMGKQIEQVIILVGPAAEATPPGAPRPLGPPPPPVSTAAIVRFTSAEVRQAMIASMPTIGDDVEYQGKTYSRVAFAGSVDGEFIEVPSEEAEARLAELKQEYADLAAEPGVEVSYEVSKSGDGKTTTIEVSIERAMDDPFMPNARYLADETTVVLAREPLLKKMMDATDVKSPLIERLSALGTGHDLAAVVLGESVRKPLHQFIQEMPPFMVPPQAAEYAKLVDGIDAVTITAGADADPLLSVQIEGTDMAAAENIHQQLAPLLQQGQQMFPFLAQSGTEGTPAIKPLLDVVGDVVKGVSLAQNESRVVFTVPRPASLDAVDDWLGPLAQAGEQEAQQDRPRAIVEQLQLWLDSHGPMPGNIYADGSDKPLLSWRVQMLRDPDLDEDLVEIEPGGLEDDEKPLYQKFKVNEPWDSEHNRTLLEAKTGFGYFGDEPLPFTATPGVKAGHTVYLAFQGPGTMLDGKNKKTEIDMKDGISGTLAIVEVSPERAVPWTQPIDIDISAKDVQTMLGPPPRPEGYPAVLFDGRQITLPADIDIETLRKLAGWDNGVPEGY